LQAYVQQLESSRVKLNQLEQELERLRQQQVNTALIHLEEWSEFTRFSYRSMCLDPGGLFG
jgi:ABC-type enterochelin transport system ATPase subunit